MSSMYPPGVPGRLCQRCGKSFPANEIYCTHCGYAHGPVQGNMSMPPSQVSWGGTPQPIQPPSMGQSGMQQWGQTTSSPMPPAFSSSTIPPSATQQPSNINNSGQLSSPPSTGSNWNNGNFGPPQSGSLRQQPQSLRPLSQQPGSLPQQQSQMNHPSFGPPSQQFGPPQQHPPVSRQSLRPPSQQSLFSSVATAPPIFRETPRPFAPGGAPPAFNGKAGSRGSTSKKKLLLIIIAVLIVGGLAGYGLLNLSSRNTDQPTGGITISTPQGDPLFADTFQNNSKGWDLQNEPGTFSMAINQGSLILEDDANRMLPAMIPGSKDKPLGDFRAIFDATLSKGDPNNGYGINIRGAVDQYGVLTSCYRISFYGDGTYSIFKVMADANGYPSSTIKLVSYMASEAIKKQGSTNHIDITAKGTSITILINGQVLKVINDSTYKSGAAEFFVSNLAGVPAGAQAKFSHLAIYTS